MMSHGSLFSGIDGFSLGFEWAGIETLWCCDIEPYAQQLIKKNYSGMEIFGDIREIGKHNLKPVDIISGGFPCQPFSAAGHRGGAQDNRYLWPEMYRVIDEVEPDWVICENVFGLESLGFTIQDIEVASRIITRYSDQDHYKGIYTLKERMYLDYICQQLEEIGYDVQAFNIPAVALGARHRRARVFVVAHSSGVRCQPEGRIHTGKRERPGQENSPHTTADDNAMAHSSRERIQGGGSAGEQKPQISIRERLSGRHSSRSRPGKWLAEPGMGRMANGVPNRVDRIKGLGNAIVPQGAELIGNIINAIEKNEWYT